MAGGGPGRRVGGACEEAGAGCGVGARRVGGAHTRARTSPKMHARECDIRAGPTQGGITGEGAVGGVGRGPPPSIQPGRLVDPSATPPSTNCLVGGREGGVVVRAGAADGGGAKAAAQTIGAGSPPHAPSPPAPPSYRLDACAAISRRVRGGRQGRRGRGGVPRRSHLNALSHRAHHSPCRAPRFWAPRQPAAWGRMREHRGRWGGPLLGRGGAGGVCSGARKQKRVSK